MTVEFSISFRTSTLSFDSTNKYLEPLEEYLSKRIVVTKDFSLGQIGFFFDIHPSTNTRFEPQIKVSAKANVLMMSMNTTTEEFMAADEKGEGLAFLKNCLDLGLEHHRKRLKKEGLEIAE